MSEGDGDLSDGSDSRALIELLKREFGGVDRPVTAEEMARLYGVMAAQHEATLAAFALVMKATPHLIFTDEAVAARNAMSNSADALSAALKDLAVASMSEDDRSKLLAQGENND